MTGEAGYTVVELMIASALLILVIITVLSALDSVSSSQAFQADRTNALDDMRNSLNKLTRELRQATSITDCGTNASTVTFVTYVNGTSTTLVYSLSGTTLMRKVGSASAFPFMKNIASDQIFTCRSATGVTGVQWVDIDLKVTPKKLPSTTLELATTVNLRNRTANLAGGS